MSDYNTYVLVRDAEEKAQALGVEVTWNSEGWKATSAAKRMECGKTVEELHHYLNGFDDGAVAQRAQKERRSKPTVRAKKYG